MKSNPFDKLIVEKSNPQDLNDLADALRLYVVLNKSQKSVEFLPEFYDLTNNLKILVILAANKAKSITFGGEDLLSTKDIIGFGIAPEGSVKNVVKILKDTKEISYRDKKYYLPNYRISAFVRKIKELKVDST